MRGPGVDLLFYLKERRDEKTNTMLKSKMDRKQVELSIFEKEPLFILKHDPEQADKTKHYEQANENDLDFLGLHVMWLNYEKISEMRRVELLLAASHETDGKKDIIGARFGSKWNPFIALILC
jgi:hypothetical protein